MKYIISLIILLLITSCSQSISKSITAPEKHDVSVILLAGQSNMAGCGDYDKLDDDLKKRIISASKRVQLTIDGKSTIPLSYTYSKYQENKRGFGNIFGPELFLGLALAEQNPDQEYLFIKRSQGGTALHGAWNPEWTAEKAAAVEKEGFKRSLQLYNEHQHHIREQLATLEAKGKTYKIEGLFWMQGESDATKEVAAKSYQENLKILIDGYRKEFREPTLPFIMGQINSSYGAYPDGPELVRAAMQNIAQTDNNIQLVKTSTDPSWSDFPKHADNVHYNHIGQMRLGHAFAEQLMLSPAYQGNKNLKSDLRNASSRSSSTGIKSLDTEHTITKVRIAKRQETNYIIANSFEGSIIALNYEGETLWTNKLSGFMNHDVWCDDITGDGNDEIITANADGHIYCLSNSGELLWKFKSNDAPMYSVCTIKKEGVDYVVCSSYDKSLYYLSASGKMVKKIPSIGHSTRVVKGKGNNKQTKEHIVNVIRKFKNLSGTENLAIHVTSNSMQDKGAVLLLEPLAEEPYKKIILKHNKPLGDLRITDYFGDGKEEILAGTSNHISKSNICKYNLENESNVSFNVGSRREEFGGFAYLVSQIELIPKKNSYQYFALVGPSIALINSEFDFKNMEILKGKYAFNDMVHDKKNSKIILGSVQSGGSNIHIIDYTNDKWKSEYENLTPSGKIERILEFTENTRSKLTNYSPADWERKPKPVYFVSDLNANNQKGDPSKEIIANIHNSYDSPIFLGYTNSDKEDPATWKRDTISNEFYRTRRDKRMKYIATQDEILNKLTPVYKEYKGLAMWGGHGNDPFFYSMDTRKKLLDASEGKKTVLIFPELENDTKDFEYVLNKMLYPLAEYGKTRNLNIHLRCKHIFWQGAAHRELWSRLSSGEFADVFVPSMEETTDKSMELSVSGRMGFWLSGAVNQWGSRSVPDNIAFDRLRQFGSQRLPNHFMRQTIYNIANGATHLNNLSMDKEYMSLVWELIAKGALYVPNRDEILSISPVHLSMTKPDHGYLKEGTDVKIVTHYDEQKESKNKMVFSRLNGTWPGAPVTDWDFSNYAANEKERRLNFIPSYNNGMVLITPVQKGALAKEDLPRGKMIDKLHPFYKDIMKEYITDGRAYYSSDGAQTYPAETYYKTIKQDIIKSAKLLPLTVSGDAGWVVAQTDPYHLRLTLVDSGYINPNDTEITVHFHSAVPKIISDILNGESFELSHLREVKVTIPCGGFRFINIELSEKI